MESNITTFRGRRCTRVKRSGGTAASPLANSSNSTSKTSTSPSSLTSVKPDVATSTMASTLAPPVPIPPPPPPESETAAQAPSSVMRSMLPPASSSPKEPAAAPSKTNAPAPAPTPVDTDPIRTPSMSVKPVMETSVAAAPPTPIAPPPTSIAPTVAPAAASVQPKASPAAPAASPKPDTPKGGGQAPAAGGQSPAPAGSDPGAAPQPAASSQRGGGSNSQNSLPAVAGGSPGATNSPNSPQPNSPNQPDGSSPSSGSGQGAGSGQGSQSDLLPQGSSPMINPTLTGFAPLQVMNTVPPPKPFPTIIVTTGKNGSPTSYTSMFTPLPPKQSMGSSMDAGKMPVISGAAGSGTAHDPAAHTDGSAHVPGDTHPTGKKVDVGAIAGGIAAVFGVALIAALIVFCGKRAAKKRNRGSDTPLIRNGEKTSIREKVTEKVTSLLGGRKLFGGGSAATPVRRSTTPALERGMREEVSNVPRNRASSAPAASFRERAMGPLALFGRRTPSQDQAQPETVEAPPRIPTPIAQHRRSASSVSSIIQSWSATGEENNPFRDPDPTRPLRLLNPDLSRSNTANTIATLRQPPAAASIPSPLRSNQYPSSPLAATEEQRSPPPFGPLPTRPQHKRSFSQSRIPNPFLDPEPEASPISPSRESRSQTPDEYMAAVGSTRHSRSRSVTSIRQSLGHRSTGLAYQNSISTIDSGFVSAGVSPQQRQSGFRNDNLRSYRADSDTRPYNLSTVNSSRSDSSRRTSSLSPSDLLGDLDRASPFSDSHRSSKLSFDFGPESIGSEPGPTRPTTSAFPSYILDDEHGRRSSRASDPFDLDRPEILGLMKLGLGGSRDTSLSRSGSGKSMNSERSGMRAKRKSQGTNWFLNSESVREI